MNILLLHGWLLGNLGDYCITRKTALFLRERFPSAHLTLVTEPLGTWTLPDELTEILDVVIQRSFREPQEDLIEKADAVLQVPGGGFQEENHARARAPFMLRDAEACHKRGILHIVAGHSFHPSYELKKLKGSLVLAREPASYELLQSLDIPSVLSADPAFLEPMPDVYIERKGTALFLRWRHFHNISKAGKLLTMDDRSILYKEEPLMLASSDPLKDDVVLRPLQEKYDLLYQRSFDLHSLLDVIYRSAYVISDRYHPIIFAAMMGIPYLFLERHGNLRDIGLRTFLQQKSLHELKSLASLGFETIATALKKI